LLDAGTILSPNTSAALRHEAFGSSRNIYHAHATWVRFRGIPRGIGGWFTEKKRSGGGALIDLGAHALEFMGRAERSD